MKTPEEYLASLRRMKSRMYVYGERVESVVDHPLLRPAVNCLALTYQMAQEPEYERLMTATSNLTGEKINRFNHLYSSREDLVKKLDMVRLFSQKAGCILRCMTGEALNGISVGTYEIDRKCGTNYHQRFLEFAKYLQKEDLVCAQGLTDPKGDRSLRPHQQADPDLYLRVVEKRSDGIVVRGAKDHISCAPVAHEIFVMPSRMMTERDKDYVVALRFPAMLRG